MTKVVTGILPSKGLIANRIHTCARVTIIEVGPAHISAFRPPPRSYEYISAPITIYIPHKRVATKPITGVLTVKSLISSGIHRVSTIVEVGSAFPGIHSKGSYQDIIISVIIDITCNYHKTKVTSFSSLSINNHISILIHICSAMVYVNPTIVRFAGVTPSSNNHIVETITIHITKCTSRITKMVTPSFASKSPISVLIQHTFAAIIEICPALPLVVPIGAYEKVIVPISIDIPTDANHLTK